MTHTPFITYDRFVASDKIYRTFTMEAQPLIYLSGKDNKKIFRYLYNKYSAPLRYFASRYLNDDAVIEDLLQEAFIDLWEKKESFHSENAIKAYLYKVVRSLSIDNIRHQKAAHRYNDYIKQEQDGEEFFLENIVETEVFQLIQSVFNELSPACRMVYELSLNGKSHEEISTQLNISINTVKKHKNNANHYMRERLKNLLAFLLWL